MTAPPPVGAILSGLWQNPLGISCQGWCELWTASDPSSPSSILRQASPGGRFREASKENQNNGPNERRPYTCSLFKLHMYSFHGTVNHSVQFNNLPPFSPRNRSFLLLAPSMSLPFWSRERDKQHTGVKAEDASTQGWAMPLSLESQEWKPSPNASSAVVSGRWASLSAV